MFKMIILTCSERLKDERTDQAIFHILQGKKSIQTVQDIFLYKLDSYYGILPKLKKETFNNAIKELTMNGYMQQSHRYENSFTISTTGKAYRVSQPLPMITSYLNGKKHGKYTDKFEQRLFLFFQVLSNKRMQNNTYVPIVDDYQIMRDVKSMYRTLKSDSYSLAQTLYHELFLILQTIEERYASIFVDRLSGFEFYGKSTQQLANEFHTTEINMRIICTAIWHYVLEYISNHPDDFPLLTSIHLRDENIHVTASAYQTKLLLEQKLSVEQIANQRRLKINTIHDHIIEITLHDTSFEVDSFINNQSMTKILQTAYELNTYQLKDLKSALGDTYSYFQIRLALARGGALYQ